MTRVSVTTLSQAEHCAPDADAAGDVEALSYFAGDRRPLHLHLYRIAQGAELRLLSSERARIAYVWQGEARGGGRSLVAGSSLIVEAGAAIELVGRAETTAILIFAPASAGAAAGAAGTVYMLPRADVRWLEPKPGSTSAGALHANGRAPASGLWLNENRLPGAPEPIPPAAARRGIHAHPADEIIFVTTGQIFL